MLNLKLKKVKKKNLTKTKLRTKSIYGGKYSKKKLSFLSEIFYYTKLTAGLYLFWKFINGYNYQKIKSESYISLMTK